MSTIRNILHRDYKVLADNTIGAFIWNRLSFWTHSSDVEFEDGETAQEKVGNIHGITTSTSVTATGYAADASVVSALNKKVSQYVSATLAAGATTLTFTNSSFNSNTHFEVWTSVWGVDPTNLELSGTTLTLTFKAQETAATIQVHYFEP